MVTRFLSGMILTVAMLTLAACEKPEEQPPAIDNAAINDAIENAAPAAAPNAQPSGGGSDTAAPGGPGGGAPSGKASGLPAAFLGRWGMTEADCDVSRSDTKGLVTISSKSLKFYESLGELKSMKMVSPIEINAHFAFSGEGQSWTKDMTLKLENGGTTLVRVEKDPTATIRHKKCG